MKNMIQWKTTHLKMTYWLTTYPVWQERKTNMEEHFPTISLDDNFWMEDPIPERHMCIHEDAQHALCPYPCLYDLNQLHPTQKDPQYMDLNDIFDFPNVMVSHHDDMPSLEEILEL